MDFLKALRTLLAQVPPGRITTFKAIAESLGDVRAAKGVYQVIREEKPPRWHRVVRADGMLPFPDARKTLAREGVDLAEDRVRNLGRVIFIDFTSDRPLKALREEQKALFEQLVLEDIEGEVSSVAGFDVSYDQQLAYAAAVTLDASDLKLIETVALKTRVTFPYISTYLAYREFDPISICYRRLRTPPSLLLIDGNGILHPAGFGIACLVGLRLQKPTIGVAKSLLMGNVGEVRVGGTSPITSGDRLLGYAYRASSGKPIYVSPGNLVTPSTALRIVKRLCRGRLPEPLRLAHRESRALRTNTAP